jgi:hypothetical protein
MRAKLQTISNSALAFAAALLLAALLAPSVYARAAQTTTRTPRTAPPSSTTTPSGPTQPRDAQTQRTDETGSRVEESGARPDLSITARVTADSLRFEKVPDPKVEFTGRPRRETVWKSDRENLPQQVQPGVTYRDIGITLRITSVFADIDRIVAEALGEVPASDDNNQPQAAPPAQPASAPPAQPAARSDAQQPAASELQESRRAPTPSPAKTPTRASTRGRAERRGRGR